MEYIDIEIDDNSFDVNDEFSNCCGTTSNFSNVEGKKRNFDPNALMTAIGGIGTMVSAFGQGKRNKAQAQADQKNYASQLALAKENNKALATQTEMMRIGASSTPPPPPSKGMSTGVKVGIGVGVLLLGVGGFFLVKKMKG